MHVRFPHTGAVQLTGHAHERQDIEVLVHRLVDDELLVPLADAVILAAVFQDVAGKYRFGVVLRYGCRRNRIRRLDVPVAVVNADHGDFLLVQIDHVFLLNSYRHGIRKPPDTEVPDGMSFCDCRSVIPPALIRSGRPGEAGH